MALARRHAEAVGLGCDFTFGTLWPFGDTGVAEEDASQTFAGPSSQRLGRSWELPEQGRIVNHLDRHAFRRYAGRIAAALREALAGRPAALFCDSWEVAVEGLWTHGFETAFRERFGYDLRPLMPEIDRHPDARYDYRRLISEYVVREFYAEFTSIARELGAVSRAQCLGAPCDLLAAYAAVDVPETEAILFDPEFARIPASAAVVSGKPVVSAEAFTCLYGWRPWPGPAPHQGEEQTADLKLLADALFANGVNQVVWHGMPYRPYRFYAGVHVGPDAAFADQLPEFNAYLARVSKLMREGRTCADTAVYLPLEDQWMKGELPPELQKPSGKYHWELHYLRPPVELAGHQPLWVSPHFLRDARVEDGRLVCGDAAFRALHVDAEWLDQAGLEAMLRLAGQGLSVCLKRRPSRPGRVKSADFEKKLRRLTGLGTVGAEMRAEPLVAGADLPPYWCREIDGELRIFFGHPQTAGLTYPLRYGQSLCTETVTREVTVREKTIRLEFRPYQSLVVRISRSGAAKFEDIRFVPRPPVAG